MSKTREAPKYTWEKTRPNGFGLMAALMVFGLLLSALRIAQSAWADGVELKNGQRVEGTFKGADDSAVKIEVGGQVITFKPEQVRAIYYGAAPAVAPVAPTDISLRDEALKALKNLQSVATAGTNFRDYSPRVSDAKIIVDRYLSAVNVNDAPEKRAIDDAMDLYILAGSVWSASITRSGAAYEVVGGSPMISRCTALYELAHRALDERGVSRGIAIVTLGGVSVVWSCASDQITEAEKLMAGNKK